MERLRKRTLIVVADSARACFLEASEDTRKPVPASRLDMISPTGRPSARALVAGEPGRGSDLTASTPTSLKRALASILPTPAVSPS